MRLRALTAAAAAGVLALTFTACSPSQTEGSGEGGEGGGESVRIGIKFDQPGLGFRAGNADPEGFDVEVAKYVANELGYSEDQIEWVQTPSANRENALENAEVDMIFATYSITDERKERVSFAGPYFVAGQDLLVRADENEIQGPEDLDGRNLCSVTGSTSAQQLRDEYAPGANLVEQGGYAECVTILESGQVDAVSTDDIILAGLAATEGNAGKYKVVGNPFTDERYGVGLPPDSDQCQAINDAITKMRDEGAWQEALDASLEGADFEPNAERNDNIELETCA